MNFDTCLRTWRDVCIRSRRDICLGPYRNIQQLYQLLPSYSTFVPGLEVEVSGLVVTFV